MNLITTKLLLAAGIAVLPLVAPAKVVDLSGQWNIRHAAADSATATQITLPGSMLTNGIGNDVDANTKWTGSLYDMSYYYAPRFEKYRKPGNIKFPFFLTPDKEYIGYAEYSKTVDVPSYCKGTDLTLMVDGPHFVTVFYV